MCGIIGVISREKFSVKDCLLKRLKRLEYRGYDSAGFATSSGAVKKSSGELSDLLERTENSLESKVGIAHTRWATHGSVNKLNAHPHFSNSRQVFVVHNGIIENHEELRSDLESEGFEFRTETDTEVIPNFFENIIRGGSDRGLEDLSLKELDDEIKRASKTFFKKMKGTFAVLLMVRDYDRLYILKRGSPVAVGRADNSFIVSSDIYGFSDKTDKALFLKDDELAVLSDSELKIFDKDMDRKNRDFKSLDWQGSEAEVGDYPHYMLKEIHEQPLSSERLLNSLNAEQEESFSNLCKKIGGAEKVVFVACGTSYHASLIGSYILKNLGVDARTVIASEIEGFVDIDEETLVVAISQSGETMDVVEVLKSAEEKGAEIVSIVNVPYSTIQRMSSLSLEVVAGQEICVAATKTFTNQVIALLALGERLGLSVPLEEVPGKIQRTISENKEKVKNVAEELQDEGDIFVLGKRACYPMAREIALKLKEIPYIHAEGMMAGELKHGTIALIEEGTPVISLVPNRNPDMLSAVKEVEARGANTIVVSNKEGGDFQLPESDQYDILGDNRSPAELLHR